MGKPRGQRNAAREKVWPGQDASKIRAFKHEDNWKDKDKRPGFTRALQTGVPNPFSRPDHPSATHQNVEAEKLDKQADEILIANGSEELAYPHLRCQKEVFAPFEPSGERIRGIPSGKSITEPKGCRTSSAGKNERPTVRQLRKTSKQILAVRRRHMPCLL